MSEVTKTAKYAAIYAAGVIIERIASFIMLPIYTRYLTPANYGTLALLVMTADIISFIVGAGLAESIFRFYYKKKSKTYQKQVIATACILHISFFLVACTIVINFSAPLSGLILEGTSQDSYYIKLMLIALFLQAFIDIPLLFIQAQQRPIFFVLVSVARLVLQLSLNIYFVIILGMGVEGVLYGWLITFFAVGCFLTIYTFKTVGFCFSKSLAKEQLKYGAPIVIASLGAFVITYSDRYFIKIYASFAEVGIYSLGYKFGFLLGAVAIAPIFKIWLPKRFEIAKDPNVQEINQQAFLFLNLITISAALGISLFCHDLLRVMSDPSFWHASNIVPVILVAFIIQAWTSFNNFGIEYSGKTKYLAYATLVSAVTVTMLNFLLIPVWGGMGAAVATVLVFLLRFFIVFYFSQREFHLNLPWGKSLMILGSAVFIGTLTRFFSIENTVFSIGINAGLFIIYSILIFFLPILNRDEKKLLLNFLRQPFAAVRSLRKT